MSRSVVVSFVIFRTTIALGVDLDLDLDLDPDE